MSITTILFDVGGVLIAPLDAEAVWARREQLAQSLGYESAETMWMRFYAGDEWTAAKTGRMTHKEMWDILLRPHGLLTGEEQEHLVKELHRGEGIMPEMAQLVAALAPQYCLGILSNWDERLELLLYDFDISRYFDVILNSHHIGMAKPDETTFLHTLEQLQAEPQSILFIDDRERNTKVAESLGFHCHVFESFPVLAVDLKRRGLLDEQWKPA